MTYYAPPPRTRDCGDRRCERLVSDGTRYCCTPCAHRAERTVDACAPGEHSEGCDRRFAEDQARDPTRFEIKRDVIAHAEDYA